MSRPEEEFIEGVIELLRQFWLDTLFGPTPELEESYARLIHKLVGKAIAIEYAGQVKALLAEQE